jgi:hypothetical protein
MRHYDDPYYRGFPMGPQWGRPHPLDPNWADGEYHGQRMEFDHRHGAYGWYRRAHERDLQSSGGFDGIYDEGDGRYDAHGIYHHPMYHGRVQQPRTRGMPRDYRYDAQYRHVENGGVRRDSRFLGQYNRNSVGLRYGSEYDRGYGHAPGARGEGRFVPPSARANPNERGYAGYNRGGFAPSRGLDPRK